MTARKSAPPAAPADAPRRAGGRSGTGSRRDRQNGSQRVESELERAFDTYWRRHAPGAPEPTKEHRFAPPRRWRFDRSWPAALVAVELEGGVWSGGRHTRGKGYIDDCIKYNAAQLEGWLVLRFTADMLGNDPEGCVTQVIEALEARRGDA